MDFRTYDDELRDLLGDAPCILSFETAAEYLGLSNGSNYHTEPVDIYVTQPLNIVGTREHLIPSFGAVEYSDVRGLRCTTIPQTIRDILRADYDPQVIQESLSNYYFENGESFDGLNLPPDILPTFEHYRNWAVSYYDED